MHVCMNNADDGDQASTRVVCVVRLNSMADSMTDRLCVLRHCIAHTYLIQVLLMSLGFSKK